MFKRNKNAEEVKDFEGGSNDYLTKSGIYEDVTIKTLIYDEAENGGAVVNLFVDNNGVEQVIYGDIRVKNKKGVTNKIGQSLLNELMVILDVDLGEPVEAELPIGKNNAMKDVTVFEEVVDEEITIKITNKYNVWDGSIKEKSAISKFYRNSDKATAAEIVLAETKPDEVEFGTKYEKDLEYAENTKYEDNLTEEEVTAWIKAKRPKGTAGASSKPTNFQKPKNKFGRK